MSVALARSLYYRQTATLRIRSLRPVMARLDNMPTHGASEGGQSVWGAHTQSIVNVRDHATAGVRLMQARAQEMAAKKTRPQEVVDKKAGKVTDPRRRIPRALRLPLLASILQSQLPPRLSPRAHQHLPSTRRCCLIPGVGGRGGRCDIRRRVRGDVGRRGGGGRG